MDQPRWSEVDQYISDVLFPPDDVLDSVLRAISDGGLPAVSVSPPLGKLLHLLARIQGAHRVLEIGTLGGYSTIWLARALPRDGQLITLEVNPKHADIARSNISRAGLEHIVQLRLGRALEILPQLVAENIALFDLVFIDADKKSTPEYFQWALKLCRPGSVIVADNVVRGGSVVEPHNEDPDVRGIRRFNEMIAAEPRITATVIQTVGSKGYDGIAIAYVA
jgi:predicted O-methyltransferase YrrM